MKRLNFIGLIVLLIAVFVGFSLHSGKTTDTGGSKITAENQIEGVNLAFAGHGEQINYTLSYNYSSSPENVTFKYSDYKIVRSGDVYKATVNFKPDIILRC